MTNSKAYEVARIMLALSIYYDEEEARRWMESPHLLLGGESANALVERGEFNRIWQVIDQLDSSAYV